MEAMEDAIFPIVVSGHLAACGFDDFFRGIHRAHGFEDGFMPPRCNGTEYGRTEQYGFGFFREHNATTSDVGMFAEEDGIFGASPTGEKDFDGVALAVHFLKDVSCAVGDSLNGREILASQIVFRRGEGEPGDCALECGVGTRGAVAVEVGLDMQIVGELRRVGTLLGLSHGIKTFIEKFVDRTVFFFRSGYEGSRCGVRENDVVDQSSGGGLTAFGEPETGDHGREIRPPNAANEARFRGDRHVAGGGAADEGEAGFEGGGGDFASADGGAKKAEAPGVGVDDGNAYGRAGTESKFPGGGFRQSPSEGFSHGTDACADTAEIFADKIAESNLAKVTGIPSCTVGATMAEVGPFANGGAERARIIAGCTVGEEIGQVEETCRPFPGMGKIFLNPEELGRLHLGRDDTPHIAKDGMAGGVDAIRLLNGAVIHPYNNVLVVVASRAEGDGTILRIESDQRTGGIETDARNFIRADAGFFEGGANSFATGLPDILGGLFYKIRLGLPHGDGVACGGQHTAGRGENSRAGTACADINTEEMGSGSHDTK